MCKVFTALLFAVLLPGVSAAQEPAAQPRVSEIAVRGATIFTSEDVNWLLHIRPGAPLPAEPAEIAKRLERLYEREGFTAAKVTAALDAGKLTLTVDEGMFASVTIEGANDALRDRLARALERAGIRPGEPFNEPAARSAVRRVLAPSAGGFSLREIGLVEGTGNRLLRIVVHRSRGDFSIGAGTSAREDLFSPVDGLSLPVRFGAVGYDRSGFNYTFVTGSASWKFGRDDAGFSLGAERPLLPNTRLFVGVEMHDLTASDDMWRLVDLEQTVAAAGFRNTFRDYYRRRGAQVHAGARPNKHNEFVTSWRWDRHEPLTNATDFSLFRTDREYRPNVLVDDAEVGAVVLAYSFDTRSLDEEPIAERFARHLVDDLFRAGRRNRGGLRLDWTSEIAGRAMKGDYDFTRHILNARGATRLGPRQSVAARGLFGWSDGTLPVERLFAVGGVGSVRAHPFKSAVGTSQTLFNAEYALTLGRQSDVGFGPVRVLTFYDAGRVGDPQRGTDKWLQAVGVGFQVSVVRIEWGFRPDDIPDSGQVLVRLGRSF
jgi:hypothetical protein